MQNQGIALSAQRRPCVVTVTSEERTALGSTSQPPGGLITRLLNQVAPGTSGVGIVVRVGVLVMAMLCAGTAAAQEDCTTVPDCPPPLARQWTDAIHEEREALVRFAAAVGRFEGCRYYKKHNGVYPREKVKEYFEKQSKDLSYIYDYKVQEAALNSAVTEMEKGKSCNAPEPEKERAALEEVRQRKDALEKQVRACPTKCLPHRPG